MRQTARRLQPATLALVACAAVAAAMVFARLVGALELPGSGSAPAVTSTAGWHGSAPLGLLQAASNAAGESDRAFWPRRTGGELRARAGRSPASFDRSGASFASGTMRITSVGLGDAGHIAWQKDVDPVAARNTVSYDYGLLSESFRLGSRGASRHSWCRAPRRAAAARYRSRCASADERTRRSPARPYVGRGRGALSYSSLTVRDASGRRLPAHLTLKGRQVSISVRTAGARFPLTVDPYIEQAEIPGIGRQNFGGGQGRGVALSADGTQR